MSNQIVLAPNPNKPGTLANALVVRRLDGNKRLVVLNIDELLKDPDLLKKANPAGAQSVRFWRVLGGVLLVASVIASVAWRWWIFIPGCIATWMLYIANKQSVADIAADALTPETITDFTSRGLIWTANAEEVEPY